MAEMDEMRKAYKILIVKSEWRRQFGSPRHRWADNIRIYFREI